MLVQMIKIAGPGLGAMAYWNGHAFFATSDDHLRDYAIKNGHLTLHARSNTTFADPGATPFDLGRWQQERNRLGNRNQNLEWPDTKAAILYAFDATKLEEPMYASEQNSQRDHAALATLFVVPIVDRPSVLRYSGRSRTLRIAEIISPCRCLQRLTAEQARRCEQLFLNSLISEAQVVHV